MDKQRFNLERLQARLDGWNKLYPNEAWFLGAVSQNLLSHAASELDGEQSEALYYLRCGGCNNEQLATLAEAIFFHRAGDPRFLCASCSAAYDALSRRLLREQITAPRHLRSAWDRLAATSGQGILKTPAPSCAPKTGDPARN